MADGYEIHLDGERAERLAKAAEEAGVPVEDYALRLLDAGLGDASDDGWAEADAAFDEYERTGEYVDAEAALAEFQAELERRLAARNP